MPARARRCVHGRGPVASHRQARHDRLAGIVARHGCIDVTDATFQTEVHRPVARGARRRRPLGAVVRAVPHARARSSRRSSTRPTARSCWSRSTSTRTRRSRQAFQVQSIPLVSPSKDGQPVDGFLGAYPEDAVRAVRASALLPTRGGDRDRRARGRRRRGQPAPGPRARPRQRGRPSSPWPSCSSSGASTRRRWRCWPASRRRDRGAPGRRRWPASATTPPRTTTTTPS